MIRVLVNGGKGRMGSEAVKAVSAHPRLACVGSIDQGDDLRKSIAEAKPEVVVDFTTASSGFKNTLAILEEGVRPVVGTSGFQQEQVATLATLAKEKGLGGVIAPNFAIGAVLMMKFAAEAANLLPSVEIIELHHDKKEESPSGTALRTAEMIAEAQANLRDLPKDHPIIPGGRGATVRNIPVHSVRLPGLVAHQQVMFGGTGESLTIRHDSLSREGFMPGVCLACERVMELKELVYGLEHVL